MNYTQQVTIIKNKIFPIQVGSDYTDSDWFSHDLVVANKFTSQANYKTLEGRTDVDYDVT